jgi:hypothetical protein
MNRWLASVLCALVLPGCFVYTRPDPITVNGGATVGTNAVVTTGAQCTCMQGAAEVCNGCDDNCNGAVDEGCGGGGVVTTSVATPTGGVVVNNPPPRQCTCVQGAQEVCGNGCDDNCNGSVDEGC